MAARLRGAAALWIAVVAYGTLLPFDFFAIGASIDAAGGVGAWLVETLAAPRWLTLEAQPVSPLGVPAAISDLVVNVLLFAPAAAAWVWAAPRRRWASATLVAIVAIAAVSWLIESAQGLSPTRFGSLNDVAANTASAGVGGWFAAAVRARIGAAAFWAFRKTAPIRHAAADLDGWLSATPTRAIAAAASLATVVAAASWAAGRSAWLGGWLPFSGAIAPSYDVAAVRLGLAGLGYLLLLVAAVAPLRSLRPRWGLALVLGLVAGGAVVIEVGHAARGHAAGVTGPVLAVGVAAAATFAAMVVARIIRRRDRRRAARSVEHDRRRRAHWYA